MAPRCNVRAVAVTNNGHQFETLGARRSSHASSLKFNRKALSNVDDPAGRWQFEGGSVTQDNTHIANYASFKRVTFQGTDQDNQNTASVTTVIFFLGAHPPESITLEGAHDFNSGNEAGSVSAASKTQSAQIGKQYARTGATDLVHIS